MSDLGAPALSQRRPSAALQLTPKTLRARAAIGPADPAEPFRALQLSPQTLRRLSARCDCPRRPCGGSQRAATVPADPAAALSALRLSPQTLRRLSARCDCPRRPCGGSQRAAIAPADPAEPFRALQLTRRTLLRPQPKPPFPFNGWLLGNRERSCGRAALPRGSALRSSAGAPLRVLRRRGSDALHETTPTIVFAARRCMRRITGASPLSQLNGVRVASFKTRRRSSRRRTPGSRRPRRCSFPVSDWRDGSGSACGRRGCRATWL